MVSLLIHMAQSKAVMLVWFKHILYMTEHDKGLGRAKKQSYEVTASYSAEW